MKARNSSIACCIAICTLNTPMFVKGSKHPGLGTSLNHFGEIAPNVYKGSTPRKEADFNFLESRHIKYIVALKFLPFLDGAEKRRAEEHGIKYVAVYLNGSPVAPSEKHVVRVLAMLHDPCDQPIYFHCDLGRDRTALIATLYREYFEGLPPQEAQQQMKDYGFKDYVYLYGLRRYLASHPTVPQSLANSTHTCLARR